MHRQVYKTCIYQEQEKGQIHLNEFEKNCIIREKLLLLEFKNLIDKMSINWKFSKYKYQMIFFGFSSFYYISWNSFSKSGIFLFGNILETVTH